jgi:hypothetical protein
VILKRISVNICVKFVIALKFTFIAISEKNLKGFSAADYRE